MASWYEHDKVLMRRKILAIAPTFEIYDMSDHVVLYCRQKIFKLKEDIRIFSDDSMKTELLTIKARQIIDFSAAYDVVDSTSGEKVGVLRRKGWTSTFAADTWEILDVNDQPVGLIKEDGLWWLRKYVIKIIPQSYAITLGTTVVGSIHQAFNPFVFKATMDLTADAGRAFDRRLALAAGILLMAIEGRQS